jgi:hypothetical protein
MGGAAEGWERRLIGDWDSNLEERGIQSPMIVYK